MKYIGCLWQIAAQNQGTSSHGKVFKMLIICMALVPSSAADIIPWIWE